MKYSSKEYKKTHANTTEKKPTDSQKSSFSYGGSARKDKRAAYMASRSSRGSRKSTETICAESNAIKDIVIDPNGNSYTVTYDDGSFTHMFFEEILNLKSAKAIADDYDEDDDENDIESDDEDAGEDEE
ncbi:MAG: hypothetical protein RSD04_03275 [Clostridia bacterium]